jgi:hypothetical protein
MMSELIVPTLDLQRGQFTAKGRDVFAPVVDWELVDWCKRIRAKTGRLAPIAGGTGSFTASTVQGSPKILAHITSQDGASWSNLATTYFGLQITTLSDSAHTTVGAIPSTTSGTNVIEPTYTGYTTRYAMAAAAWNAPSAGAAGVASAITNNAGFNMTGCTAGTSTVIGWFLCDQATASGNVICWGSATSVVVSSTQTPPAIGASGAIQLSLL